MNKLPVTYRRFKRLGISLLVTVACFIFKNNASAQQINIVTNVNKVSIYYDKDECRLDSITASLLALDIEHVSGYKPVISYNISKAKGNIIVIGSLTSRIMRTFNITSLSNNLKHKWECYGLTVLVKPKKNIEQALIITGSDYRGTAYGVFDISARIGVTPWYWWADANPVKKTTLSLNIPPFISKPPSVKYRGIFINDEDWGLKPWAAKTLEPETGDIGPKTYAKVFELLLRLKANFIWPAMHPSTKAFYHYPGNIKAAEDYQIVIGSSHAEPMLRNNVGEWDAKTMGAFNYVTNQSKVDSYWESRVKESSKLNAIYTIGMRGVHDSGIEGVKTLKETVPLVERIFGDQREMFKKYKNADVTKVPQAFTPYKEVLDVYNAGLKVPDDVTLVWPDDNYGYIQRLDNEEESKRAGGSGVYYHASYWGRPHDYLWLSTTSPALMREEMTKAYQLNARNLWVLNVGDIKPAEYEMQLFLDMGYQMDAFGPDHKIREHLENWVTLNIGQQNAKEITDILLTNYQLAFERRPEFMGWSRTYPNTHVQTTAYNHEYYGDQGQRRIDAFQELEDKVRIIQRMIAPGKQDSFFQLVYYPVVAASLMNKKFLYRDKALLYAVEGRLSAKTYDSLSRAAYQQIISETKYFNTKLSDGKWAHIMSMQPRDLDVFHAPDLNYKIKTLPETWCVRTEGFKPDSEEKADHLTLPIFERKIDQKYFVDVFLSKPASVVYTVTTSAPWITVSRNNGHLDENLKHNQQRLWVGIDYTKIPTEKIFSGNVIIQSGDQKYQIAVKVDNNSSEKGFIANNGYLSIYAKNYQQIKRNASMGWNLTDGFGTTEGSIASGPIKFSSAVDSNQIAGNITQSPFVAYNFVTFSEAKNAKLNIYALPTAPLNPGFELRYGVSLDDGPVSILNIKTKANSEEWQQNVLSNSAVKSVYLPLLTAGKHRLKIFMIDPGVILDRFVIDLTGVPPSYGVIAETMNR